MFVVCAIVTVLVALITLSSAMSMFQRVPQMVQLLEHVGMARHAQVLGGLQIAGALGLIVGLFVPAIGIAAAIGLILYYAGALIMHLRLKDPLAQLLPAIVMMLFPAVALALRIATI
jgi:hypothetical protein